MKYLILKFQDAKLFRNKDSQDKVTDYLYGNSDRGKQKFFKEPITTYQVSNVLHVLFGEKPVPSLKKMMPFYKKNEDLFEKANNSYLKFDSYYRRLNKNKDKFIYITEIMQTKKSLNISWNPVSYFNWERIRLKIGDENFKLFLELLESNFGVTTKSKFIDIIKIIQNQKVVGDFLIKIRKKVVATDINNYHKNRTVQMNQHGGSALTVTTSIEHPVILSGTILVPVTDADIIKVKENKGCATILDGGLVYVDGIEDGDTLSDEGFEIMQNISTEKY